MLEKAQKRTVLEIYIAQCWNLHSFSRMRVCNMSLTRYHQPDWRYVTAADPLTRALMFQQSSFMHLLAKLP